MQYPKAKPAAPPVGLEVCVNLWWFVDNDSGLVFHVSGRGYALSGDDESKLKMLRSLAVTDFHISEHHKVPQRFTLTSDHGTIPGVIPASAINDHPEIFEPVYQGIEKELHQQVRSVAGEYEFYTLELPKDPLCVLTCVVEDSDGNLTPMIA